MSVSIRPAKNVDILATRLEVETQSVSAPNDRAKLA
jgi:hypothetical protein